MGKKALSKPRNGLHKDGNQKIGFIGGLNHMSDNTESYQLSQITVIFSPHDLINNSNHISAISFNILIEGAYCNASGCNLQQ